MDFSQIVRPSILKLKAYSSARSLTKKFDDLCNTSDSKIFLDANENFESLDLKYTSSFPKAANLNRYPMPQPQELLKRFAEIYNTDPKNILITRGSDEAIDILTRALVEPRRDSEVTYDLESNSKSKNTSKSDSILIQSPTYGMYQVSNEIQNGETADAPLIFKDNKWVMDFVGIQKILSEKVIKIFYICNPNNPTGTLFSKSDIYKCLEILPKHTLLVIDQAYYEFTDEFTAEFTDEFTAEFTDEFTSKSSDKSSDKFTNESTDELKNESREETNNLSLEATKLDHPQLVVLRTLSKAWGLAGLRLGSLIAHPDLIAILQKVIAPYPIPTLVSNAALEAVNSENLILMKNKVNNLISLREDLKSQLLNLNCVDHIYESSTNFLLIKFNNSEKIMNSLYMNDIIVRDRSTILPNCIRITVGSASENLKLIQTLKEIS